jgi:hypothetical protein
MRKPSSVRAASERDLPAILQLTAENRALLARLEPGYWRPSANADESHSKYIQYTVTNPDITTRVLEREDQVIGFAVSNRQPTLWFIDDVCLATDADWVTDGVVLLRAIEERPAAMTAPHGDTARIHAAAKAGLELVSTHRAFPLDQYRGGLDETEPGQPPANLVDPPFHTFGPAMPAQSLVFIRDDRGGYAAGSRSFLPPPIYDVGGTAIIIDRVVGDDRESLLTKVLKFAAERGDVGATLVVGADDEELIRIADRLGAWHPVDVFRWLGEE